ncbi:hypothetical protein ACOSQ2_019863 [Xanthoceras sorbifolium]
MTATLDFLLYLTLPCHQSSPPVPRFIVNRHRNSLHRLPVFLASQIESCSLFSCCNFLL